MSAMFFPPTYYKSFVSQLWSKKCPHCNEVKRDLKQLKNHVQTAHEMKMCELCLDNRLCFPCEQKVYSAQAVSCSLFILYDMLV